MHHEHKGEGRNKRVARVAREAVRPHVLPLGRSSLRHATHVRAGQRVAQANATARQQQQHLHGPQQNGKVPHTAAQFISGLPTGVNDL